MEAKEIIVNITKPVYGGTCLGETSEGKKVFVPGVIPGEKVKAQVISDKEGYAHAKLLEILDPSQDRIKAICPHFGVCGGCHYQHIPYPLQLKFKQSILQEQFFRIGHFTDVPLHPINPSPGIFNYRNNIELHISRNGIIGFQAAGTNHVIEIRECFLPLEELEVARKSLEMECIPGLDSIELRCGINQDVMVVLHSHHADPPDFLTEATISAVFLGNERDILLAGNNSILHEIKGMEFSVSAGSFFQVNIPAVEVLLSDLLSRFNLGKKDVVMDVFCGVGLFSAFLAPLVKKCIGIETSTSACKDYAVNLDKFNNVELYQGDVADILPYLDIHPKMVLVDPPRGGLGRSVAKEFLRIKPQDIFYISCDPSTLVRDARYLVDGGYHLVEVIPYDFFPQTFHLETLSVFRL